MTQLDEIVLSVDELEAIRLADMEGMYQADAASQMKVSRQTFGRILTSAHEKVGRALVKGMALKIEGGQYEIPDRRAFQCGECGGVWEVPVRTGRPDGCPSCKSLEIHCAPGDGNQSPDEQLSGTGDAGELIQIPPQTSAKKKGKKSKKRSSA